MKPNSHNNSQSVLWQDRADAWRIPLKYGEKEIPQPFGRGFVERNVIFDTKQVPVGLKGFPVGLNLLP
jgi:hypothetical protein